MTVLCTVHSTSSGRARGCTTFTGTGALMCGPALTCTDFWVARIEVRTSCHFKDIMGMNTVRRPSTLSTHPN
jgi:hypothetical protein